MNKQCSYRKMLCSSFRFIEAVREPRTVFIYNNLMFVLLGHICELLAGTSFEELVQSEIFDKVNISQTENELSY